MGQSLKHLGGLKLLLYLNAGSTQITDDALPTIAGLPYLQFLDISYTEISDKGIQHLTGAKQLGRLFIYDTKVTAVGEAAIRKAIPGIMLSWRFKE